MIQGTTKQTQTHYFNEKQGTTKSPYHHMGRVGGVNIITAYIQTPRFSGDSPKEIQPSNKGISFGEEGAGKRKIEAQAQFDVNCIVSYSFGCFASTKLYKRLEPIGSNGAAGWAGLQAKDRIAIAMNSSPSVLVFSTTGEYSSMCIFAP